MEEMICVGCGFQTSLSPYYAQMAKSVKCPACQSTDKWKKRCLAEASELVNDLWKRLLYLKLKNFTHKNTFRKGQVGFSPKFEKAWEYYTELKKSNPPLAAALEGYLHLESTFALLNRGEN